jgi:hypothetical protein
MHCDFRDETYFLSKTSEENHFPRNTTSLGKAAHSWCMNWKIKSNLPLYREKELSPQTTALSNISLAEQVLMSFIESQGHVCILWLQLDTPRYF